MKRLLLVAALLAPPALAAPPSVVADTAVVHSLAARVMGDLGAPVLLLDRGADPHSFQLRPSQARALSEASLLFWIGPELTPWLERALHGTGIAGEAVSLLHTEGTRLRGYGAEAEAEAEPAEADHGHAAGPVDPHAWLDPSNAALWTSVIAARLAVADPENAGFYLANAEAARAELSALDAELKQLLAPAAGQALYVFHDAYGYFAEAYGLTVAGSLASGDAADPGAARLAALRAEIAAEEAPCLFAEAGRDPAYMAALAEGTGLGFAVLDPEGAAQEPGPGLYAATLRALAAAVAGCAG